MRRWCAMREARSPLPSSRSPTLLCPPVGIGMSGGGGTTVGIDMGSPWRGWDGVGSTLDGRGGGAKGTASGAYCDAA